MKYTWKKEDLVKTTRDLRHETESGTYIPKDTIVQIIDIWILSGQIGGDYV